MLLLLVLYPTKDNGRGLLLLLLSYYYIIIIIIIIIVIVIVIIIIIIIIISSLTQGHAWGHFSGQVSSRDFTFPTPFSKYEPIQGEQTFGVFFSYPESQFAPSDTSVASIVNLMPQLPPVQPLSLFSTISQSLLPDLDTSSISFWTTLHAVTRDNNVHNNRLPLLSLDDNIWSSIMNFPISLDIKIPQCIHFFIFLHFSWDMFVPSITRINTIFSAEFPINNLAKGVMPLLIL